MGDGGSLGGRERPWCMSALGRVMGSPSPGGHCTFLSASRDGPGVRLFNPWWVSSILGETTPSWVHPPRQLQLSFRPSVCGGWCGGWSRVHHTTRAWIYIHQVTDPPLKVRWTQNTKSGLWFANETIANVPKFLSLCIRQFLSKKISTTESPERSYFQNGVWLVNYQSIIIFLIQYGWILKKKKIIWHSENYFFGTPDIILIA